MDVGALEVVYPPHTIEVFYWVSQILTLVILVVGAFYARTQLDHAREQIDHSVNNSNALLLMELDKRWDSEDMKEARKKFFLIREEINESVGKDNALKNDQSRIDAQKKLWSEKLGGLRQHDQEEYLTIMSIMSFFETAGLMVHRGYIDKDDVRELLLGPVLQIENCFGPHILEREKETGVTEGLFKHARKLCREIQKD
ncbi:MAG: hypothetical protein AAF557_16430 [Pseudomonadota bacterium]